MASFVTGDHDVAGRFRVAQLTGRLITGAAGGHTFANARVQSVRRDLMVVTPRWTIVIEQQADAAE